MPKSKYEVHRKNLKEIDFEALILKVPQNEVEDKLAYLAREKGNISKSLYEDFVIGICIANINDLLSFIRNQNVEQTELMKIRNELVETVKKTNPSFVPENLIINRNYVIKVKDPKDKHKKDERFLVDNKSWETSYYDDSIDEENENAYINSPEKINTDGQVANDINHQTKDIDDLEFDVAEQWWRRLNQYVNIKKYKEADLENILKNRFFHNRSSFQTFVVSVCVVDFEDLFNRLDELGIPQRVAPPILMNELYKLCEKLNPFLTYEKAQDLVTGDFEEDNSETGTKKQGRSNKMASTMSEQYKKTKKKKKKFKDVIKEDLLTLGEKMKVFVVGQDEAVDSLVESVQRASVGLKDPIKPIGSFLFAGKTGVGKSLTSKVLADELIKDKNNIVTIDCSEYSSDHEYSKLIGAPSGYIGYEQGGILTNAVSKSPFSVVVFDEVEKASNKVHELLLQVLEEGRLTDGKGTKVTFKDTIVIMTSNIGVDEVEDIKKTIGFGNVAKVTDKKRGKALNSALKKKFKPEFLNRIDAIINFRSLKKIDYMKIIDIELYKLSENLKNSNTEYKDIELKFDDKIRRFIYKNGVDDNFGARPLKRYIESNISTPLATKFLKGNVDSESVINVSVKRKKVIMDVTLKTAESPFYMFNADETNKTLTTKVNYAGK